MLLLSLRNFDKNKFRPYPKDSIVFADANFTFIFK